MAWFTTPTRHTRAGWTASGACTSGSTARHSGATQTASCSAATTTTRANKPIEPHSRSHRRLLPLYPEELICEQWGNDEFEAYPARQSEIDDDLGAEKDQRPEQERDERGQEAPQSRQVGKVVVADGHDHANHHPRHEDE